MEAATHPTAGWERVGDRFYRKTQLYTAIFDQDLDLDHYIVAGAPYGGAIGEEASYFYTTLSTTSANVSTHQLRQASTDVTANSSSWE
jgi:hypothetical protein